MTRQLLVALLGLVIIWEPASAQFGRRSRAVDTIPSNPYEQARLARDLGLKPLWLLRPLPPGHREVRIWTGGGEDDSGSLVLIRKQGSRVTGASYHHRRPFSARLLHPRNAEDSADAAIAMSADQENQDSMRARYGCGPLRLSGRVRYCTGRLARGRTWADLLAVLDGLGVQTLPDQSWLDPPLPMVLDAWSITVELLEGSRYRTYGYTSPEYDTTNVEARAIRAIVDSIWAFEVRAP